MGDMNTTGVSAIGIANIAMDGTVLDTWYPHPELSTDDAHQWRDIGEPGTVRLGAHDLSPRMLSLVRLDEDRMVEQVAVRTTIADLSQPPIDAHDVYLRLHLLSHRLVRPHELNMEGVYQKLTTVVWTNKGPCLPDNFEFVRTSLRSRGLIHVYGIDHLPRMVDYVVPTGVRIAEAERVRLGAYLASGTKVLREGFVSYNAGTRDRGRMLVLGRHGRGRRRFAARLIRSVQCTVQRRPPSTTRGCVHRFGGKFNAHGIVPRRQLPSRTESTHRTRHNTVFC